MNQTETPPLVHVDQPPGIYRLVRKGDVLEPKDAVYLAEVDEWRYLLATKQAHLIGTPYDPDVLPPVRRFNKTAPTQLSGAEKQG